VHRIVDMRENPESVCVVAGVLRPYSKSFTRANAGPGALQRGTKCGLLSPHQRLRSVSCQPDHNFCIDITRWTYQELEKVCRLLIASPTPHHHMSVAYELLGSVLKYKFMAFDEAMQCYEKSIDDEYKPPSIDGKQWASRKCKICGEMALAYNGAMHDMVKADEWFRRGLEFYNHHMGVYEDYADFLRGCGRISEAVALYDKVVSKDDEETTLLTGSCILFIKNFIRHVQVATDCMCERLQEANAGALHSWCCIYAVSDLCWNRSWLLAFGLPVPTDQTETNCR